jgi:ADP-ribose pyrophosphatase YjhB (NUDIX family)
MFFWLRMIVRAILSPVVLGAAALAEKDGKIVLVRQSTATGWSLPGGAVERNEPPSEAVLRELREEIGLVSSQPPEFFGLYARQVLWITNLTVVYRLREVVFDFKPGLEIRAVRLVDPADLPLDIRLGTRRLLLELAGKRPPSPYR